MSTTLNFFDMAWTAARASAAAGRRATALAELRPLLSSPQAPQRLRVLAHRLAARLEIDAGRYPHARNHLRAAIRLDGYDAELHYELGIAFESDPSGCDLRAARRFRRATQLNARHPKYAAAFGRALVRLGRERAGVRRLRLAAQAAPADAKVLAVVVEGLCAAGRATLAERVVIQARFRAPADKAIRGLWDDVRFALAQGLGRRTAKVSAAAPRMLPFVRREVATTTTTGGGGVVRRDAGARAAAPHLLRLRAHRS